MGRIPFSIGVIGFLVVSLIVFLAARLVGWIVVARAMAVLILAILVYNALPVKLNNIKIFSAKARSITKILQITDFHSASWFRVRQVLQICKQSRPDVIVISGDLWDNDSIGDADDMYRSKILLEELCKQSSNVFLVSGDHDREIINSKSLVRCWLNDGVSQKEFPSGFIVDDVLINGVGVDSSDDKNLNLSDNKFNLVVCHYPDYAMNLIKTNPLIDLVLAGDTHGGQVRLPFVGAIYCPNMPIFPELRADYRPLVQGLSQFESDKFINADENSVNCDNGTALYVCTGIGSSSSFPIRLFCRPQVSLITISPSQ